MPAIPTVLAGSTLANGLSAHFRDGYGQGTGTRQHELLAKVMDLGLPSTARQTPYAYYETAPYPRLNPRGGRDHWPGCWSALFAGGGVRGGQVIGSSDSTGSEPRDRPVTPAEVAATVYWGLGLDPSARLPGPDGRPVPLTEAAPVLELFS